MRNVVMDVLSPWVEVECPSCGLDLDFKPEELPAGIRCYCGHKFTKADLADRATLYAPDSDE